MGDARFDPPLLRLRSAKDRVGALRVLRDAEVLQALAAASKEDDPHWSNVLATEALNRHRRQAARLWGVGVAYAITFLLSSLLLLWAGASGAGVEPDEAWIVWLAILAPPLTAGVAAYAWRLRWLRSRAHA